MSDSERPEIEGEAGTVLGEPGDEAVETIEATEAAPSPRPRRRPRRALVVAIAILVVFLAGLVAWPLLGMLLPRAFPSSGAAVEARLGKRLQGLEQRLDRVAGKIGEETVLRRALENRMAESDDRLAELAKTRQAASETATAAAAELQALRADGARLDRLEARIESTSGSEGADSAEVAVLADRVARLEAGLGALGSALAAVRIEPAVDPLKVELAALRDRLAKLETLETLVTAKAGLGRRQALVLAVGQLAIRLRSGQPYRDELDRLAVFAGEDAEVTTALTALEAGASSGLATTAMLRRRFEPLLGAIVRAGEAPPPEGWIERTTQRLASLVTVRRTDRFEGPGVDAVVNRVELSLAEGDLQAAARALSELQGAAAELAAPWRQAAEARLIAERALAGLEARVIALLGAG